MAATPNLPAVYTGATKHLAAHASPARVKAKATIAARAAARKAAAAKVEAEIAAERQQAAADAACVKPIPWRRRLVLTRAPQSLWEREDAGLADPLRTRREGEHLTEAELIRLGELSAERVAAADPLPLDELKRRRVTRLLRQHGYEEAADRYLANLPPDNRTAAENKTIKENYIAGAKAYFARKPMLPARAAGIGASHDLRDAAWRKGWQEECDRSRLANPA
jgi:hypothetical protein